MRLEPETWARSGPEHRCVTCVSVSVCREKSSSPGGVGGGEKRDGGWKAGNASMRCSGRVVENRRRLPKTSKTSKLFEAKRKH